MAQFNTTPTFDQPLNEKGLTSKIWYRFFQSLAKGIPPAAEVTVTATGSPYTYTAAQKGFLIVQGGTVSLIQVSRTAGTNHATGITQGVFPLSAGDSLVINYSVAPNLTFVPQ